VALLSFETLGGLAGLGTVGCSALLDLDVHYVDGGADVLSPDSDATASNSDPDATGAGTPDAPTTVDGPVMTTDGGAADESEVSVAVDASFDSSPATGGIQFVQASANSIANGQATVTVQLPAPVTAGDTLVVCADASSSTGLSIMDTLGSQFVVAYSSIDGSGTQSGIGYAIGVAGGAETVTFGIQSSGPLDFLEAYVQEYSGVSAFDVATAMSGTATLMESGYATTTAPNDLVFAFGITGTARAGTGFTTRSNYNDNLTEDEILVSPGSVEATATQVSGSGWTLTMAAFKPR
jgi:hypothetical protein